MFEIIDQDPRDGAIIKVIGVGGCGGNAVEHMIRRGLAGVDFICANTDCQVLEASLAGHRGQGGAVVVVSHAPIALPQAARLELAA